VTHNNIGYTKDWHLPCNPGKTACNNPMPGTFEWWYLQGAFTDGSNTQITYEVKPWMDNNGPLQPYVALSVTTPNGTVLQNEVRACANQFKAARNTVNVTIGNTWLRGDLNTIRLHFPATKNGVGAKSLD
jgi:hypothetical protein